MDAGLRVLLVEDDALFRRAVVRTLKLAAPGVQIQECGDGREGLGLLRQPLDCAILDWQLPGLDGLSILRQARQAGIRTPIILLTGQGDERLAVEAMRAGAADYLSKASLSPESLLQSLRHARRVAEAEQRETTIQEQLRASEERLGRIVDTIADGILILDLNGRYTFVNPAAERIFGVSASRILGCSYRQPPWRRTRLDGSPMPLEEHPFCQVMASGRAMSTMEIGLILPDGGRRVVALSAAPLRDKQGAIEGVVASVRDVTDRKRTEEALRQSEHFVRNVMSTTPDVLYIYDLVENFVIYSNRQVSAVLGYTPEQVQAMGSSFLTMLLHPDDFPTIQGQWKRLAQAEDGQVFGYECRMRHANGQWRWLFGRETVFSRSADGKPRQIIGTSQDITERKSMEEALRQSNERLSSLINASPLAILVLDTDWRVRLWNPAAERIFGWKTSEVLGGPLPFLVPEEQEKTRLLHAAIGRGEHVSGLELRRRRKDGSPVDVSLSTAALRDGQGRDIGHMGIVQDITEANRLKAQLLQAHRMETVGRLAGGIAHDFNNLLAVITGYSESLLRRLGEEGVLAEQVREIEKAADRGASLTRQLLAFSRRQAIAPQLLDLRQTVDSVYRMLRHLISDTIRITVQHQARTAPVKADPGQMEQVLVNLALNARDAMPAGGELSITTSNVVLSETAGAAYGLPDGKYVRLEVRDTGLGMDEEVRARLFEPFFTTKEGKGTGLGLSIVYGIVQQSAGAIAVSSRVGEGSVFEVFLPRARQAPARRAQVGGRQGQGR